MPQNSTVTEFVLLGLTQDSLKQKMVFIIFLTFYMGTVVGNTLIILATRFSRVLRSPMYFLLFHLSFTDSCFSISIAPRLITDAFSEKKIISYNECMAQGFALHFFDCMEIFTLLLMAVDHYVAICKPLHYPVIMSQQVCVILIILSWIGSFIHSTAQIVLPLLKLACMDTYIISLLLVSNSGAICSSSFIILLISYFVIVHSLRNHSGEGRKKALFTCTSHIIVVILFFGPCIFIYARPPTTFSPWTRWWQRKKCHEKLWHFKIMTE
uniref:G-protein coupled receptors family 1 profile domain-containing protein n=1 Tax=Nannospalax galili TaxID=1026970 RepID=A0A8C6RWT7_NANGA